MSIRTFFKNIKNLTDPKCLNVYIKPTFLNPINPRWIKCLVFLLNILFHIEALYVTLCNTVKWVASFWLHDFRNDSTRLVLVKWRGPYLTVPMKRTGSWGMTDSLLLKSSRPMWAMLTPSMMIDPRLSSVSLKSAMPSEDFPEETTHLCHNLFPPPVIWPAVQTNTNNIW